MGISPGIPPGEAGEPEWWRRSMRVGGSWKGLPDVVGAWLPEYPHCLPRLVWARKMERVGGVHSA